MAQFNQNGIQFNQVKTYGEELGQRPIVLARLEK